MSSKTIVHNLRPRRIAFHSLKEVQRDAEQICSWPQPYQLGNWTVGQALEHLAKSFQSSLVESKAILPRQTRLLARLGKPFFLRWGLPAGVQIEAHSKTAAHEFLPGEHVTALEGLAQLTAVISSIATQEMRAKHNLFGRMTSKQWMLLHCRHAELHLRLFVPRGIAPSPQRLTTSLASRPELKTEPPETPNPRTISTSTEASPKPRRMPDFDSVERTACP